MSEERVLSALRALAERDRGEHAPPELEAKLVAAFHRSRRLRLWKRAGLGAAAAAVVVVGIAVVANRGGTSDSLDQRAVAVEAPKSQTPLPQIEAVPVVRGSGIAELPPKTARPGPRARVPRASIPPVSEEVATDFFPLMDVAPPFGRGEIVRITVPAAVMRSVGLPVREERLTEFVQADVLLGEEGMARAIRFVNFTH